MAAPKCIIPPEFIHTIKIALLVFMERSWEIGNKGAVNLIMETVEGIGLDVNDFVKAANYRPPVMLSMIKRGPNAGKWRAA